MDAYVLVVSDGETDRPIGLTRGRAYGIGRYRDNDIILRGRHVSRHHAVIFSDEQGWKIRDNGSANGTLVNGTRITEPVLLADKARIVVGDVELHFGLGRPPENLLEDKQLMQADSCEVLQTVAFRPDALDALYRFMSGVMNALQPQDAITVALDTIHRLTRADVVGFLGVGLEDELLPRVVLPQSARREYRLSKRLTAQVKESRRSIWLQSDRTTLELDHMESLVGFEDAICVPLLHGELLIGALHVYQQGRSFQALDVRLCEIVATHLASALRLRRLLAQYEEENLRLRTRATPVSQQLVGSSRAMQQLRDRIAKAAANLSTVLIVGETGVGKELVATEIHRLSPRRDGPLVTMNCGGLTPELVQSALCGHRRGAFTGAESDKKGYLLRADGGILFLDEIGELPEVGQTHFLRVLEGKPFTPVGADEEITADVRFIAATNRDLEKAVREGRFRHDLYYRLNRVQIRVPPLRERREDIPELVSYFLSRLQEADGRSFRVTPQALARLQEYDWPGNVRQLFGVLESACCFLEGDTIDLEHLCLERERKTTSGTSGQLPTCNLEELRRLAVAQAMCEAKGNTTRAAELLGVSRSTLLSWRNKTPDEQP
ncbi:MAG: sigma 54-interacting transcriptional regulator [Gemmatales bacterium]|nr:sigma 54-interacting transcriptional regulator [Gemmatales bacterium]MDW8387335.1 sigma 54-interacting transcriptional regulator [Gemmatales bacterium]